MNGPLWTSHAHLPTAGEAAAVEPRRRRVEMVRKHILGRRRGEGHPHPDRYWWHEEVARTLRQYGPMPARYVLTHLPNTLESDAERYCREMTSWGEVETVAPGWVHLRGVAPNHDAWTEAAA